MNSNADFLALDDNQAEQRLLEWRDRINKYLSAGERVQDSDLVILVTLEGGAKHRAYHPDTWFHHHEFMETCRRLLRESGVKILPAELDGMIPDLVCGWLQASPASAVISAARIHQHFRRCNELYRPPWMHEKHACVAIGANEYAAIQLLKLTWKDQTLVEPSLWAGLDDDFRLLAQAMQIDLPDLSEIGDSIRKEMRVFMKNFREPLSADQKPVARLGFVSKVG